MNMSKLPWQTLVTGAGGFIGAHLVENLLARKARVRAFVRYTSAGTAGWLDRVFPEGAEGLEIVFGDLRDPEAVARATAGCSHVFHLGAVIAIPYSYQNPREFVAVNVGGTQNVLEAVRRHNVERAVFTSTSEVYGSAQYVPIDENHPKVAQSPYSASKVAADALVQSYACSFDVPAVIARPFNTYGPRQSLRAIVPTILAQALTGEPLRLGSLEPTRDLNFVTDTANGLIACATAAGVCGETFNLGSGREISIGDLAEKACALAGVPCRIEADARRLRPQASEVMRLCADGRKAHERLGWAPETTLEAGLETTLNWMKQEQPTRWVKELQL
jgi:NAD dependent epimerase/dehydratase